MPYPPELDRWLERIGPELCASTEDVDIDAVLALASRAAHDVARPAAPLTTYLVGVAVGRGMSFEHAVALVAQRLEATS